MIHSTVEYSCTDTTYSTTSAVKYSRKSYSVLSSHKYSIYIIWVHISSARFSLACGAYTYYVLHNSSFLKKTCTVSLKTLRYSSIIYKYKCSWTAHRVVIALASTQILLMYTHLYSKFEFYQWTLYLAQVQSFWNQTKVYGLYQNICFCCTECIIFCLYSFFVHPKKARSLAFYVMKF